MRRLFLVSLFVMAACLGDAPASSVQGWATMIESLASTDAASAVPEHECRQLEHWVSAWRQEPAEPQLGPMAALLGYCGGVSDDARHPSVPQARGGEPLCREYQACVQQAGTILGCEARVERR
jgi:hypothetical protein